MTKIPLLIDTDPGVDDAMALLMAFAEPGFNLLGLCITAGNVGLSHTLANAAKLCDVAGIRVPLYPGCREPLFATPQDAAFVHGQDGFGDTGYLPVAVTAQEHAALAIVRLAKEHEGELLLVCLGPLSNLALALKLDPALPQRIKRLVIMGGAVTGLGNTTASAEFNFGFDPEAAALVLREFPHFELVDWEAVLRYGIKQERVDALLDGSSRKAQFFRAISRKTRDWSLARRGDIWFVADALAMLAALRPEAVLASDLRYVEVACSGLACGASIVDWQMRSGKAANALILREIEPGVLEQLMARALSE